MRILFILFMSFCALNIHAQVNGNKTIVTKTYALEEIYRVNVQMYAKVYVDMKAEPGITITGESNLLDWIGQKTRKGVLTLDQKKWIEPTQDIIIKIGAPGLRELEMGTHDITVVENINGNIFKVEAPIGEVVLKGKVEELRVKSKMGKVDASALESETAQIDITSDGEVIINTSRIVDCDLDEEARFKNINTNANQNGCIEHGNQKKDYSKEHPYINVKIKNNSLRRNHFVVVGPKPNGRKFSYGFPMMPYQSKKERWTVGTKVYKENSVGQRTLLVTLTAENEGEEVKLF